MGEVGLHSVFATSSQEEASNHPDYRTPRSSAYPLRSFTSKFVTKNNNIITPVASIGHPCAASKKGSLAKYTPNDRFQFRLRHLTGGQDFGVVRFLGAVGVGDVAHQGKA